MRTSELCELGAEALQECEAPALAPGDALWWTEAETGLIRAGTAEQPFADGWMVLPEGAKRSVYVPAHRVGHGEPPSDPEPWLVRPKRGGL